MNTSRFAGAVLAVAVVLPVWAHADAVIFTDYDAFVQAAGSVQTIDFETLPDGSPSVAGTEITPEFNYTDQGVTFSPASGDLTLHGSFDTGYGLLAESYPAYERTWIIADLTPPAYGVGVYLAGGGELTAYGDGGLVATATYDGGGLNFLGILSDDVLTSAAFDRGSYAALIKSFHYAAVPDPGTLCLIGAGSVAVAAVRRRRTT